MLLLPNPNSQEIGRAGRDGRNSTCSLFLDPQDVPTLQGFIRGDTPSRDSMRLLFTHIFQNSNSYSKKGDVLQINRSEQEKLFDIRVSTFITIVEDKKLTCHCSQVPLVLYTSTSTYSTIYCAKRHPSKKFCDEYRATT